MQNIHNTLPGFGAATFLHVATSVVHCTVCVYVRINAAKNAAEVLHAIVQNATKTAIDAVPTRSKLTATPKPAPLRRTPHFLVTGSHVVASFESMAMRSVA